MNISTDPDDPFFKDVVLDHPMKPYGIQYWQADAYIYPENEKAQRRSLRHFTVEQFVNEYGGSPQACSWLRDQEYLVNIKYHEDIGYLHLTPKIRLFLFVQEKLENLLTIG